MGLDCYIQYDIPEEAASGTKTVKIWYGRKTNAIHGWFQRKSGIEASDFNCEKLPITEEMLHEFEVDLAADAVTPTSGFFFGSPEDKEEIQEDGREIIEAVREALLDGKKPYYFSWW